IQPTVLITSQLSPTSTLFFFNVTAPTEIYTLSLHDALPIWSASSGHRRRTPCTRAPHPAPRRANEFGLRLPVGSRAPAGRAVGPDRKSTRLNSSHVAISYAVFCLKKKKGTTKNRDRHRNRVA